MVGKQIFLCPLCGGKTKKGKTTFTVEMGFGVIVIRDVDATVCLQCGADWIENRVAEKIEKIVNQAKKQQAAVEVVSFPA